MIWGRNQGAAQLTRWRRLREDILGRLPVFEFAATPAFIPAFWLAIGTIAVVCPVLTSFSRTAGWLALAGASLLLLVTARRAALKWVWLCPLGALLALLHIWAPWRSYRDQLPRDPCGAEIRAVIIDAGYSATEIPWLNERTRTLVRIEALRLGPELPWQSCRGKIILVTPRPLRLAYGTRVQAEGAFVRPRQPTLPGGFDYRFYLRSRGVEHLLLTNAVEPLAASSPAGLRDRFMAMACRARAKLAENLVANMRSTDDARIAVAMTLGYREGLDPVMRRQFLESGAIHMFAISGLHVGIALLIANLILRGFCLPYRLRHALLPLVLAAYVFLTGAAPSATRAWMMITIWVLATAMLKPTSPLNAVAVAAIGLLVWNPLLIGQNGFIFSFIIVIVLILGWRLTTQTIRALDECNRWRPQHHRHPLFFGFRKVRLMVMQALACSILAWFGSAGLVAYTNQMFMPAGIAVNLIIAFLALGGLLLAAVKLVTAAIGIAVLDVVVARSLEAILGAIRLVVSLAGDAVGTVPVARPPVQVIILYYALFMLALLPGLTRRLRLVAISLAAGCLVQVMIGISNRDDIGTVALFTGGGNPTPGIVLAPAGRHEPIAIGTGFGVSAQDLHGWVKSHGYDKLQQLVIADGSTVSDRSASWLARDYTIATMVLPSARFDRRLQQTVRQQRETGGRIRYLKGGQGAHDGAVQVGRLQLTDQGGTAGTPEADDAWEIFRYTLPGNQLLELGMREMPYAGAEVCWQQAGQSIRRLALPLALEPVVLQWDLNDVAISTRSRARISEPSD
jgi:ComEC/Rec2-related protein